MKSFHQISYDMLRIYGPKNNHAWIQRLSVACLTNNAKKNNAAGIALFVSTFGGEAKLQTDLIVELPTTKNRVMPKQIRQLWNNYESKYAHVRKKDAEKEEVTPMATG